MELEKILKEIFKNSNIPEDISDLKIGDIEEWDSIGNFNLILAVEQKYDIQFDLDELEKINSIHEIKIRIDNALSKK